MKQLHNGGKHCEEIFDDYEFYPIFSAICRRIVYMQSNTATVPVAITTDEISRATIMIAYPASYGS
jgi:hypothetical protein